MTIDKKNFEIKSYIGKNLVQVIKEFVSVSHCNSFFIIANKDLENPLFFIYRDCNWYRKYFSWKSS